MHHMYDFNGSVDILTDTIWPCIIGAMELIAGTSMAYLIKVDMGKGLLCITGGLQPITQIGTWADPAW